METNKMPIAKAGEVLQAPKSVTAKLAKASSRVIKETDEPIIVLEFAGVEGNVLRTVKQAKGDLIDYYTKEQLAGMSVTLAVASYNRYFKNKDVQFIGSYHEAGAIQVVDENSKLFTNGLNNPATNQPYAIGDEAITSTSGVWVEGFLSVVLTDAELDAIIERELKAMDAKSSATAELVP